MENEEDIVKQVADYRAKRCVFSYTVLDNSFLLQLIRRQCFWCSYFLK